MGLGSYSTKALGPALLETKNCELKAVVTGTKQKEKIWAEKYNLNYNQIYKYLQISKDYLSAYANAPTLLGGCCKIVVMRRTTCQQSAQQFHL